MEHKLITGGEQYLPFARSRIKALRATGLAYASQQFELGDASVKVRVSGEHEFITIEASGGFTAVYPNVQYPETVSDTVDLLGNPKAKLLTGTFPATEINPAWFYTSAKSKTRFGTTPFSAHRLRMSRPSVELASVGQPVPLDLSTRTGVTLGATLRYDVFADGALQEQVALGSPFTGSTSFDSNPYSSSVAGDSFGMSKDWETHTSEHQPCLVAGPSPILAALDVDTTEHKFSQTNIVDVIADTSKYFSVGGANTTSGQSRIVLRSLHTQQGADGQSVTTSRKVTVAALPYAKENYATENNFGMFVVPQMQDNEVVLHRRVLNDVERFLAYRRWHASERVSVASNGAVFVLRETNEVNLSSKVYRNVPSLNTPLVATISRGYSLSFVSPKGQVQDHAFTADLGAHGYIDGVFPSADGKKAYVYYGLHDASEALPTITDANLATFLPLKFTEHLDVVKVAKDGDSYVLSKVKTIDLGAIELRTWTDEFDDARKTRTDHFVSKLHGAAAEAGGFIWADRYCYDIKSGAFMEIPGFVEYLEPTRSAIGDLNRDQITGPNDDRASYLRVASGGKKAAYTLVMFGLVLCYKLVRNAANGALEVLADGEYTIPGGYLGTEYLSAEAARFQKHQS